MQTGMAKFPPLMRPDVPVSLMELLAIPLGCQKTTTMWLVISPTLSRWKLPLLNPLMQQLAIRLGRYKTATKSLVIPQAGEEANEKSNC